MATIRIIPRIREGDQVPYNLNQELYYMPKIIKRNTLILKMGNSDHPGKKYICMKSNAEI